MSQDVAKLISQLLTGELKQATLTALNTYEAIRYSLTLDLDVKPGAKLIITADSARHLLASGHLTGRGNNDRTDDNPLNAHDLANLPIIFKQPDRISFFGIGKIGYRIKLEKRLDNYQRLVLDVNTNGELFTVVTYFNTNKKPLC